MKKKKIPIRKCIACGEQKSKFELIRIVRNEEKNVEFDESGKKNGRGAYICKTEKCLTKAIKTGQIARALNVKISDESLDQLLEKVKIYANK
jgi:predicted RNA-binding protein YlxR (DUF448 family)